MTTVDITTLNEDDWQEYRVIRLQSLQDSPDSFGSTHEREIQFSKQEWQSRICSNQPTTQSMLWAAAVEKKLIGLLSMVIHSSSSSTASLYQMWVAPEYREIGAGTALINRAIQTAMEKDAENVSLSVTTTNTDAISLYKKLGFVETGFSEPLREGSTLESMTMNLKINAG